MGSSRLRSSPSRMEEERSELREKASVSASCTCGQRTPGHQGREREQALPRAQGSLRSLCPSRALPWAASLASRAPAGPADLLFVVLALVAGGQRGVVVEDRARQVVNNGQLALQGVLDD